MPYARHHSPASPEAGETPVARRLGVVVLVMAGIAAAILIAVRSGAITLPGSTQGGGSSSLAAARTSADQRWASGACTDVLNWTHELHRDATSFNLGFGPLARIDDAVSSTTRMLGQLNALGLPPGGRTARGRAEIARLRSDVQSRARDIEGAATSVASGNLAAIGSLVGDVANAGALGSQAVNELRHVVTVDLGLSLVETRACRQLVGIPI